MFGIDISNYQKGIDLSKKEFDFAIVKATEGINFVDPSFSNHIAQLTELGKLIGCYHFARPDNQSTVKKMIESADHFIDVICKNNLLYKAILVLDWEKYPTSRTDLMIAWLDKVYDETSVTPFIYANTSFLYSKKHILTMSEYPIWAAQWPENKEFYQFPSDEWIIKCMPKSIDWDIWQYTSNGRWPGFEGRVDFDYTAMSEYQWKSFSFGDHEENISDDMKWAIENGLYKGYSDGSFRQDETLTRKQLATVLRRYDNMLRREGIK